jgi:hypothetical protein
MRLTIKNTTTKTIFRLHNGCFPRCICNIPPVIFPLKRTNAPEWNQAHLVNVCFKN